MSWEDVGNWLKTNGGTGASLIGALATGNIPAAAALGASLIGSATGASDPKEALSILQLDPKALVRLKELYYENEADIRTHNRELLALELEDKQKEHNTTQETVRNGDNSQYPFVRNTRPAQSWASLLAAFVYVFTNTEIDVYILGMLLTLPWAYAGLRQIGKGITSFTNNKK